MTIEEAKADKAEFHQRQLDGTDWQTAAIDLGLIDDDGEYMDTSAPSDDCPCSACQNADWE